MKLCVFCSANQQIDPDFFDKARELGVWAAKNGHSIVFGGHDAGLMHSVSKAAKQAGGMVIGVVPRVIEQMGRLSPWLDVHIPTEDLSDRKSLMMAQSDAFIVMPGGIGTLDELFTVASAATLGYHDKPIILYNIKGFWDSLIACLDDLHQRGVTRKQWRTYIQVATTLEELEALLAAAG
ncbi:MAG: TIGR00730 family Rossman fold protein [Prevotella sp.]|nr:TIGR00730 family Rossman fold protein [Prevotella sp.]MBR6997721.1 TIGR00730 family Rossman fold protein [Prevotella sp.]